MSKQFYTFLFVISIIALALSIYAMTVTGGDFSKSPSTFGYQVQFLPLLAFGIASLGFALFSGSKVLRK